MKKTPPKKAYEPKKVWHPLSPVIEQRDYCVLETRAKEVLKEAGIPVSTDKQYNFVINNLWHKNPFELFVNYNLRNTCRVVINNNGRQCFCPREVSNDDKNNYTNKRIMFVS